MGQVNGRLHGDFDDAMGALAVDAGDETRATGVVLLFRVVKTIRGKGTPHPQLLMSFAPSTR